MSSISELIQQNSGTFGKSPLMLMICEVVSVSKADRTCNVVAVTDNLAEFPVQLMSDVSDGVLTIPAVGSTVKVLLSEQATPTVVQYSEVDELYIVSGGSLFRVYSSGIELEGTNFGGVPISQNVADRLNIVERKLNDLQTKFLTWAPVGGDGGAALKTILTATPPIWTTPALTITTESDIANDKVKHGDGSS